MFEGRVCNWSAAGIEQAMKEAPSSRCCPGIPLLPRKALREAEARSTGRGGAQRGSTPGRARVRGCRRRRVPLYSAEPEDAAAW